MLDYPSAMVPHPNPQLFHHYAHSTVTQHEAAFAHQDNTGSATAFSHHNYFHNPNQPQPLYDPRAFSLDPLPKTEEVSTPVDFTVRIGLNLGVRTYFSSADHDFVNRLYRRSRPGSINALRCLAEGCNADLTHAKHYHRRHKVCEFHSKASTVIAAGLTQRFCQQCSRFHLLSEFDSGKRSCRKRLAEHNRRRQKFQRQENQKLNLLGNGGNSSSDNPPSKSLWECYTEYGHRHSSDILVFRFRAFSTGAF